MGPLLEFQHGFTQVLYSTGHLKTPYWAWMLQLRLDGISADFSIEKLRSLHTVRQPIREMPQI